MYLHDALLTIAAFISEILGTLSGFGSSTFFVPLAIYFEKIHLVLALTAILHCFGNTFKIYLFKEKFDKILFVKLAIPSIILTGLGAILSDYISIQWFQKFLGALLMIIPIAMIFKKKARGPIPEKLGVVLSGVSGFFTGFIGTGGALRGLVLATMGLEKNTFVLMSSGIDIGGDLFRAIIYLKNGYMDWSQWFYLPLLGVAAFGGARVGKKILQKIDQKYFEKIVAGFIFMSGLMMLLQ